MSSKKKFSGQYHILRLLTILVVMISSCAEKSSKSANRDVYEPNDYSMAFKTEREYTGISFSLEIFATAVKSMGEKDQIHTAGGKGMMSFLKSNSYGSNVHEELFWRKDQMSAARVGDYKLVRLNGKQTVLYNLKTDIAEVKDLSSAEAVTFKQLNDKLEHWEVNLKKPIWIEPEDWNKVTWMIYEDLMNNKSTRVQAPTELNK